MRIGLEILVVAVILGLLVWTSTGGKPGVTIHGADGVLIESVPCPTAAPTRVPPNVAELCRGHIVNEQAATRFRRIHQLGDIDNACQPDQYVRLWVECMNDDVEESDE